MRIIQGLESVDPPLERVVLTVGNFDGMHRAHQGLFKRAARLAGAVKRPVVALTFDPHPLTVVAPQHAPPLLTTKAQKLELMREVGADLVVIARSEPALLGMEADRFVEEVLIGLFRPVHIVEGPSFGFGRGRKGTPELLASVAGRHGCPVHIVDPVYVTLEDGDEHMVSSSLVRKFIAGGRVRDAAHCLGRPYSVTGRVVEGARRGRTIGFPTANLGEIEQLLPGDGVYAGRAIVGGNRHPAAINVGSAPTFDTSDRRLEAHLLDFSGDIYGESILFEFDRRLRDQRAFGSASELAEQLQRDVEAVRGGRAPSAAPSAQRAPAP